MCSFYDTPSPEMLREHFGVEAPGEYLEKDSQRGLLNRPSSASASTGRGLSPDPTRPTSSGWKSSAFVHSEHEGASKMHPMSQASTHAAKTGEKNFDALIVGAGPAGVSCSVWLQQLGFRSALIDANPTCGGLQLSNPWTNTWIATSVNAHGKDVAAALQGNAERHGSALYLSLTALRATPDGEGWKIELSSGEALTGKALVLAGGVTPKTGGLVSRAGLLIGPGPQVAATNFSGSTVAILGGGDNAFENYQFVRDRGASRVTIFARTLKARAEMLERVPAEDVVVGPYEIDAEAKTVGGKSFDHILVLYGYEAHRKALVGLEPSMTPSGFVQTDQNCRTSIPGVWAIGELAQRMHPCCVTSMADGIVAAKNIQSVLETSKRERYIGAVRRGAAMLSMLKN